MRGQFIRLPLYKCKVPTTNSYQSHPYILLATPPYTAHVKSHGRLCLWRRVLYDMIHAPPPTNTTPARYSPMFAAADFDRAAVLRDGSFVRVTPVLQRAGDRPGHDPWTAGGRTL